MPLSSLGPLGRLSLNLRLRWLAFAVVAFSLVILSQFRPLNPAPLLLILGLTALELLAVTLFVNRMPDRAVQGTGKRDRLAAAAAEFEVILELVLLTAAVHLTGGVLSPLLLGYVIYLFCEGLYSSPRLLAANGSLAALLVLGLLSGEYYRLVPHVATGLVPDSLIVWSAPFVQMVMAATIGFIGLAAALGGWTGRQIRNREQAVARSEQALQNRMEEVTALREISRRLSSSLDLEPVLDAIGEAAVKLVGATDVHLFLYDESTNRFTRGVGVWADGHRGLAVAQPREAGGLSAAVVKEGKAVVIDDAENHPFYSTLQARSWQIKSIAGFPLSKSGRILGVLNVAFLTPHAFGEQEIAALQSLAEQAAVAVENARLFAEGQARLRELSTVYAVSAGSSQLRDRQAFLNEALGMLVETVQADAGLVAEAEDGEALLSLVAQCGLSPAALDELRSAGLSGRDGFAGEAVRLGRPVAAQEISEDPRNQHQFVRADGFESIYVQPVRAQERAIGIIQLMWKGGHVLAPSETGLIAALGQQIAVGSNNLALYIEARRRAEELASLRSLGLASATAQNPREQMRLLYEKLAQLLQPDLYLVALYDPEQGRLQVEYLVEEGWLIRRATLPLEPGSLAAQVIENGKSLNIPNAAGGSYVVSPPGPQPTRQICSWLGVPLVLRDKTAGLIAIGSFRPGAFSLADERFLIAAGQHISITLDNSRLLEEAERRAREVAFLNEIGRVANDSTRLVEVIEVAARGLSGLHERRGVAIWLRSNDELRLSHGIGLSPGITALRVEKGVAGRVARTDCPALVVNGSSDPDFVPLIEEAGSEACVPIHCEGRVLGVIEAQEPRPAAFSQQDMELLAAVADRLAFVAVRDEARAHQELYYQASHRIAASVEMRSLLDGVTACLRDDFGFLTAVAFLFDESGETSEFAAGSAGGTFLVRERGAIEAGIIARAARSGLSQLEDVALQADESAGTAGRAPCAALALPLKSGERVLGVLYLESSRPAALLQTQVPMIEIIAAQLANAVDKFRLQELTREQSDLLRQTQLRLVESERRAAIGELAAGLAHEINHPLTAILGHTQLMLQAPAGSPESLNAEIAAIHGAGERIARIIKEFVRVANIEAIHREVIDLRAVLDEAVGLIRLREDARAVVITVKVPEEPAWISGSKTLLKQVIVNILSNAVEAIPNGGTIDAHLALDEHAVICLIRDTGTGIEPELVKRILEPGFSTKPQTANLRGAGMGLYTAERILRNHNGSLTIESRPGGGTTVRVELPRVEAEPSQV